MEPSLWTKLLKKDQAKDRNAFDIVGRLPEEISIGILGLLDNASLLSCALVSKRWFHVIHADSGLRFRVFNRLRRLRWVKQKYGEQREPKQLPRIVAYGLERAYSFYEKYQNYKERKEDEKAKRRHTIMVSNSSHGRIFVDYLRRKILRGPKELVPGLRPSPAQLGVYRHEPFSGDDALR